MGKFKNINVPPDGEKITVKDNKLSVPNNPIVAFIEGDGIGPDIWSASKRVFDAAVAKAFKIYGKNKWLPEETVDAIREYLVAIKGPLTTPIGGGIRSLNVSLRQQL